MNCVQAAITDYSQNVVDFVKRREVDSIQGQLACMCATLNITEQTLLLAAQHVSNAMYAGATKVEAYAAGIRFAKQNQTQPTDETVAAWNAYQAALWEKRRGGV